MCAGGHGIADCVVSVDKVDGVNCRGAHVAGDWQCPVRERQVARVRVVQKVLYGEAVKKVEDDGSRGRDPERIHVSSRSVPA
jgi:hypothetical protein